MTKRRLMEDLCRLVGTKPAQIQLFLAEGSKRAGYTPRKASTRESRGGATVSSQVNRTKTTLIT